MDRKQVVLPAEDTLRQREYERKIAALHRRRGRTPLALVDTFGCQQNVADSQYIMGMLRAMGCSFTDDPAQADVVVLNTCAIRDHAEKRVFGNLGALTHTKKANPEQIICLCGCMAQRPEVAEKVRTSYRHVDLVFGPQAMWKFPELLYRVYTRRGRVFSVEDEHGTIAEDMPVVREGRTRAWVSIMYGCNNFCTYCIIPYARGRVRSMPLEAAVEETKKLAREGYREIVVNGIEISSWGWEWKNGSRLSALLLAICQAAPEVRIRLGSLEPRTIDEDFCKTLSVCKNLCPQFHLSLQSGSDTVLKRMNRKYDTARYLESVRLLHRYFPGCAITTDLIVGFPGETEQEFAESLEFLKTCGLSMFHIFPYSRRKGTPAASMPDQIEKAEKERRAAVAGETAAALHRAYLARQLGTEHDVLFEQTEKGYFTGHTMNYVKVYCDAENLRNEIRRVRITALFEDGVLAEPVSA